MAITADYPNLIIISDASITDIVDFHGLLRNLESDPIGMLYPIIHTYKEIDLGGGAIFPAIAFINGWTLQFTPGNFAISGGNLSVTINPVANCYVRQVQSASYAVTAIGGGGGSTGPTAEEIRQEMDANSVKLATIQKMVKSNVITNGDIITIYEDDGITPWKQFDLANDGRLAILQEFAVDISVVGDGTVDTPSGTFDEYTNLVVTATPNPGSLFKKFTRNGVDFLINPISTTVNSYINLIATFVNSVMLTLTKTGYGSVTPDTPISEKEIGSTVIFTATPQDTGFDKTDSYFHGYDVNGALETDNPLSLVIPSADVAVDAIFKLWNNNNILFNSVPVNRNGTFLFENKGSGQDSEVKNVSVAQSSTAGVFVNSGVYLQGQTEVDLEYEIIFNSTVNQMLFTTIVSGLNKGLGLYSAGTGLWYLVSGNGTSQVTILNFSLYSTGYTKFRIQWNGLTGGLLTLTITDKDSVRTYSVVNNYSWVGNSDQTIRMGHNTSTLNGKWIRMYAKGYCEYVLNHGQGSVIHDISGNGNNGTVTGANLLTFWGSTANNIEPYDLTKGAALYEADVVYLSGELITNGSFDNGGAGWTPSAQCSVNNGYGHIYTADGSSQTISQIMSGFVALNKHFLLEFDIIESVIGGLTVQFNGSTYSVNISGVGHKKIYLTSTYNSTIALYFNRQSGVAGVQNVKIDNISLRETLNPYIGDDGSIMPICYNKPEAIPGYTRLGYFPPNSGILKGLPNTYNVNGVDRNFAYLKALATSETRIKTETDNNISYFKERSKDV